jgi:hypothetical protein
MTPSSLKLPFITYGTTRLGDTAIPAEARVKLALAAMQKGVYFHTPTARPSTSWPRPSRPTRCMSPS